MNKYPKYKPSGIDWIGEIPEHWEVIKIKYSLSKLESGSRDTGGGNLLDGVFSIGGEHIGWFGELLLNNPKFIPEEYFNSLKTGVIRLGDVLLVKDGATIGKCAVIKKLPFEKCAVNEHVFIMRSNTFYFPSFMFYFLWCNIGREQILLNIKGSAQPGLNSEFINKVLITKPTLPEQTAIANFLDEKAALIDSFIEKKKKLIDLLKEERQAIINQAVTKGINPNAKMKPSGIDWLGDIPEHWEVKKLKWVTKTASGSTPNTGNHAEYYDGDIYWVRTLDLNNSEVYETEHKIKEKAIEDTACKILPIDTVCVAMYGGGGTIGKNGILKIEASINQAICAILPNHKFNSYFLFYFIQFYRPYWMIGAEGTRRDPNISQDDVKEVILPFPCIIEQNHIVQFIETETQKIDNTISKIEKEIELIQEYRTALISEVVTGKVRVTE